jgi:hypothetical protein
VVKDQTYKGSSPVVKDQTYKGSSLQHPVPQKWGGGGEGVGGPSIGGGVGPTRSQIARYRLSLAVATVPLSSHLFIVGDSPEGPLKQLGKPCLKTCKKPKLNASHLSAHTGQGPRCGGPRGPPKRPTQRSPRAGSASLEGASLPRVGSVSLEAPSRARSFPHAGTSI